MSLDLVEMYRGGASLSEIADASDKSYYAVRRDLMAAGVEIRPRGRPQRELPPDIGAVSDREIARREGVTPRAIATLRKRRGF